MTTKHTGGPAFPVRVENGGDTAISGLMGDAVKPGEFVVYGGLTIRDYFAAKAIQGLLANPGGPIQANGMNGWNWCNCSPEDAVNLAYSIADAMLKAREET